MRVQVVEDNPTLRDGLAQLLCLEGFVCETFANGSDALAAFQVLPFDIAVLDVVLPGLDGLQLCRAYRAISARTQILMLSARGDPIDKRLGLEMGADDYVAKPFDPGELTARVAAMARRLDAPLKTDQGFQMGDIWVDLARHLARRGNMEIELNPREMAILSVLHEYAGQPVSRDTLFDRCWGRDYFANSRSLDQYMSGLRRKIEADPQTPVIIETVRGIGYRFTPKTQPNAQILQNSHIKLTQSGS